MADLIDHIEALSANIGPRPVSTEEEHQASCYVAQQLTDAGLEVDMDEFATPSGVNWPFCTAFVLMIVGTALSGLGMFLDGVNTAFLAVGLVLLVIGAIIYFAEHSDHPLLSNAFNRGVSQNVVAKYVPSSLARENRRRKVIIVAHVDTVRSELQANPALVNYFPTYTRVLYYTTIVLLALLVIRLFPIPWPDLVDLILWILSLVGCLVPLAGVVCIVAHKLLPYVEGANDNASGVAVMLDVANRILDPQERERLAQERSGEQPTEGAAEEDEDTLTPQPVVHDAATAVAAGVVADGAEIEYAADAREADADTPDATKVMPALDDEAAPAATEVEAGSDTSSPAVGGAVSEEPSDEDSASVLEFPHPVSEAAIGSATASSAAVAEQAEGDDEEVVDADYEDAAVSEVNAAEQQARSATLDEAQTAMQPRPHPKHEPEPAPRPEPEPEPDPSTAGMPAWYVAARKQAERERSASDESAEEEAAVARSRFADIPLEGIGDLDASEEVSDAEAEVEEEEAPKQPLEEPPSAYADTDEETPAPAAEETHEEAPAAEETHEEAAVPTDAAEHEEAAAPTDAAESAETATAQPVAGETAEPPADAGAAPSESVAAAPAAEATPSETATPTEQATDAAPAAAAAEKSPADEPAASASTPAEQTPAEEPTPQPAETPTAEQAAAAPAAEKAEPEVPAATEAEVPADKPAEAAAQPAAPTAAAATEASAATEAAPEKADEAEPAAATAAATDTGTEEPESPADEAMSEAARELPTRIPAIGSSGSVSSERRVSQLRSELESSIAGNAKGSEPVARTRKDTKDAAPARRKPTARRVTEAFQPTKAVEDRDEGFTGVTQAAAVSSTYEDTPQAGATQEPEFDPFAPSSMPEPAAPAAPQRISPSASSQFPTVSPSASSQFPTVSPSASSQFPTVSPSASSQFPTVSPSASTQFPTVPASAAVSPSDFGAPAAPTDYAAPTNPAPAPNVVPNQADYAAPTNPVPTAMPSEPEPVEEYATLDPEIAVPQSRFRDALDGVAGAFGRIGRRNRRNQDQDLDGGAWTSSGESDGGNGDEDEDIGWKGGAYYAGEDDDEMQDEAAFDDEDAAVASAEDSSDELHPGRSGSFDPSAIDSARARAAQIRESIVTMTEHDLLDKEVWFVALGASSANNRGMRNFLDLHATELRGSLIINLEAVGAGDICYVDLEGRGKVERADRRLQTLVRKASKDLGEVMSAETLTWRDTDATPAMRAGLRAMTIMGFDGVAPTAWHWHTDTTLILEDDALDYTTKLILKMIENS